MTSHSQQIHIYKVLQNAIVACVDLTLKVTSTFINQCVKFLQFQLS